MRHADFVVVVSSAEAPILKGLLPNTPIAVFPVLYAPVIESPAPYANRKNIFFLGGFGHSPNVNAVHWFAAEIWPHIRKTLPDLEFYIIGADAPESVAALGKQPGIRFMGFVADLESMLQTLRIGVAPLLFGAGIKGKVAMAMGSGVACVCTGIAAEGMDIENDVHALVEDDPTRFARAVVSLYQDEEKWNKLSRNGQLLTQNKFSDTANLRSLLKVLNQANALPIKLFCNHCQTLDPVPVPVPGDIVDVSVIVPVFNKWEFTRACLTSILRTSIGSGIAYEVILADDGSADETTHATQFFPGLRIVKTPENMGFLRNCNNAAKHALGRYILLLNNDTVVLPGWLASLYETIETDSSIAIVGSKLVYPDGTIQEAGGILFNDGSGCSVGRGANRFTEVFNIQREVDYVSGTSILIRRQFWEEIAGFDQRYRNAYCEDSDLAMTARSKGMRVVYEPRSEVIHFEHQSYQDQLSSDTHDMLQKHNQPILFDKWKDVFLNDHLPSCSWWLGAASAERALPPSAVLRRKSGSLNILYFSPFPSHPCKHGNQATIQQFAKRFQLMGHKVHFALLQSSLFNSQDAQNMSTAWDSFDILQNSHPLAYSGLPIPFDGWYEEGQGECVRFLCARYEIDVVFCSYIFQSKILEYLPNYILKVIDTHDKMGNRYEMLQKNGQPPEFFSCTYEEEGIYLRRADVVVARREEEARYFDSVTGRETAIVVPHVEEPHFLERKFGALHHVGMLASANRINLAIARGCIEAIDQRLSGQAYPFTLHIAGQLKEMIEALPRNERTIYKRPWVRLRGFIPDIAEFYSAMDLVVSPVTMGTGINVKTVQAMAYGMPLLSTACGSKGIETGDAMHSHQNLESLVEALMSLVDNPEELNRLATLSRSRYQVFYDYCLRGFDSIFSHPKLYKDI
jgi:GT2 family glycosyltransferase/glycosyltransferase involved in cell wall biosynthesis